MTGEWGIDHILFYRFLVDLRQNSLIRELLALFPSETTTMTMTSPFRFHNLFIDRTVSVAEDGSVVELSGALMFPSIAQWLEVMQEETQHCARAAALGWEDHDDGLLNWQESVVWFVETTYTFRGVSVVGQVDGSVRSSHAARVWGGVLAWVVCAGVKS